MNISEKQPCIVGYRSQEYSAKFNYTLKDYKFPIFFTVYTLDDILVIANDGEYLKKGYIVEMNTHTSSYVKEGDTLIFNTTEREFVFDPPRKITYFVNYISNITLADSEKILTFMCPKSGSLLHNKIINNKAIQKLLLKENNLLVVFLDENESNQTQKRIFSEFLSEAPEKIKQINFEKLQRCIYEFILDYFRKNPAIDRVIVKNANWLCYGTTHVKCICRSDLRSKNVFDQKISPVLTSADNESFQIIVEEFYYTTSSLFHRIRCYYQKCQALHAQISDLYFTFSFDEVSNLDSTTFCVNRDNFSGILEKLEIFPAAQTENIYNDFVKKIRRIGDDFQQRLTNLFKKHDLDQTFDSIMYGFDLILTQRGEELVPNLVEINGLDSLYSFSNTYFLTNGNCRKLDGFHNHLLTRSYEYMTKGERIALIGFSAEKRSFLTYCQENEIKVYLIDHRWTQEMRDFFCEDDFIKGCILNAENYRAEADQISDTLKKLNVSCILTLECEYVPFKILLQDKLNLKYNLETSYEESLANTDRIEVYTKISNVDKNPRVYEYAANFEILNEKCLLDKYEFDQVKVLRTKKKCNSFAASAISNKNELIAKLESTIISRDQFFLSSFYKGSKHCLHVIMSRGECLFYIISDETGLAPGLAKKMHLPSKLISGQEADMATYCIVNKLRYLDLNHGVFSIDFIQTSLGLKIIDVNSCPKGDEYSVIIEQLTGINILKVELLLNLPIRYVCRCAVSDI